MFSSSAFPFLLVLVLLVSIIDAQYTGLKPVNTGVVVKNKLPSHSTQKYRPNTVAAGSVGRTRGDSIIFTQNDLNQKYRKSTLTSALGSGDEKEKEDIRPFDNIMNQYEEKEGEEEKEKVKEHRDESDKSDLNELFTSIDQILRVDGKSEESPFVSIENAMFKKKVETETETETKESIGGESKDDNKHDDLSSSLLFIQNSLLAGRALIKSAVQFFGKWVILGFVSIVVLLKISLSNVVYPKLYEFFNGKKLESANSETSDIENGTSKETSDIENDTTKVTSDITAGVFLCKKIDEKNLKENDDDVDDNDVEKALLDNNDIVKKENDLTETLLTKSNDDDFEKKRAQKGAEAKKKLRIFDDDYQAYRKERDNLF